MLDIEDDDTLYASSALVHYVSVLDAKDDAILDVFCIFPEENDVVDSLIMARDSLVERLFILCERSLKWQRYNPSTTPVMSTISLVRYLQLSEMF